MATVNLGRIKPIWKGAWSNSTAYVVDDIVSHSNQSYICIQAGTNQNPSTATAYWSILAAKGTDGTDVGATLTTQGDVLYRDGSGLQRLAKPASDMYLKNTSGGVVSWAALSSDFVKIASGSHSGTQLAMDNIFADGTTYRNYKVFINYAYPSSALYMRGRTGGASGSTYSGGDYRYRSYMRGWNSNGTDHDTGEAGWDHTYFRIGYTNTTQQNGDNFEITIVNPNNTTKKLAYHQDNLFTQDARVAAAMGAGYCNAGTGTAFTGLEFTSGSGSSFSCDYAVYGMKQ